MLRSVFGAASLLALLASQAVRPLAPAATASSQAIATYCPRPLHRATRLDHRHRARHDLGEGDAAHLRAQDAGRRHLAALRAARARRGRHRRHRLGGGFPATSPRRTSRSSARATSARRPASSASPGRSASRRASSAAIRGCTPASSFCVDDPTSLLYGKIVDKRLAATVKSSEDMSAVPALQARHDRRLSGAPRRQGRVAASSCTSGTATPSARTRASACRRSASTVLQKWSAQGLHGHRHRHRAGGAALQGLPAAQQRDEASRRPACRAASPPRQGPARRADASVPTRATGFACGEHARADDRRSRRVRLATLPASRARSSPSSPHTKLVDSSCHYFRKRS